MRVVTEDKMTIAKVEVERFSLTSSNPFDAIVAALKSAVGQPDMVEFFKETRATNSFPDLERVVQRGLGRTDLMLFAEFDLGDILRRESGSKTPKIIRLVIGNPLIMKEMVKHVPDAGSYAPVTVLVDERPDGRRGVFAQAELLARLREATLLEELTALVEHGQAHHVEADVEGTHLLHLEQPAGGARPAPDAADRPRARGARADGRGV